MILDAAAAAARLLPAETAHRATIAALAAGLGPRVAPADDPRLAVRLPHSGLVLPNPIGLAAGFDKNAEAFSAMLGLGFGFVECGTVTPRPQAGNPRPRLFRLIEDRAVINRMGFNNQGLERFKARLARRRPGQGVIGANVGANKDSPDRIADYVEGLAAVWPYADYITLNVSSPNTPGLRGLQDRAALEALLARTGAAALAAASASGVRRPMFLKVAPDLDDQAIEEIAACALAAPWLQGLIVSNTTIARPANLIGPRAVEQGGLSGAPLFDPSTRVLAAFAQFVRGRLDLIGVGGVAAAEHILAKLAAGAQAVQLYTALALSGPSLVRRLKRDLLAHQVADGGV